MKPYERPSDEACERAANWLEDAVWRLDDMAADNDKDANWCRVLSLMQDGLAELGFDLVPLKQPAPATAEAYGPHDYAASRGQ